MKESQKKCTPGFDWLETIFKGRELKIDKLQMVAFRLVSVQLL